MTDQRVEAEWQQHNNTKKFHMLDRGISFHNLSLYTNAKMATTLQLQ